jgi:hypothetical protein
LEGCVAANVHVSHVEGLVGRTQRICVTRRIRTQRMYDVAELEPELKWCTERWE